VPGEGPIGRHRESARIADFLASASEGLQALALTGPAGIGKTTVWAEGARLAGEDGWLVLSARPSGAEARLSYAGLTDLLSPLEESVFRPLPRVQRHALDVALLRADPGSSSLEGRSVAAGVLTLLGSLAAGRPVLIAVDDAQWLDAATSEALSFSVRRLLEAPVAVLVAARVEEDRPSTFELALPSERRSELQLEGLSVAALHDVLKAELGVAFPRPTLVRIAGASGGNPFYALEIARELERTGTPPAGARLPIPGEIRELARSRLARLPRETQEALLVVASLSRPTTALVDLDALEPAEEAGVVLVDDAGKVRFSHPLLASAVYETAPAASRRRVHRRLGEDLDDPEERARHLALIADRPDEAVAQALHAAAAYASKRGAAAAAAELARRALELTDEGDTELHCRRVLAAGHYLLSSGELDEARTVLEAFDSQKVEGDLRGELLLALGKISWYERGYQDGHDVLLEALRHAERPELVAEIHIELAWLLQEIDPEAAIVHTDAVVHLLDPDDLPGFYSRALLHGAYLRLVCGHGADHEAVERGVALQEHAVDWAQVSPVPGMWALLHDDFDRARSFYGPGVERSLAEGDELSLQGTLIRLVEIELWTGDWARADEYATHGIELADRISSRAYLGGALYSRGFVDAHLGRVDEAREAGERILELLADWDHQRILGYWVLGFLALSQGDPATADEQLTRAAQAVETLKQREPARFRFYPDHVEAVIQLGELERAEELLAALEERARIFPRPWILATNARCRGLLLSARGDLDGARTALEEALDHHQRLDMPFERARTLLALGQLLRRRKERREARDALKEALGAFEELGAPLWAGRASAELARVPVRRASSDLTATEETIAGLAGTGLTNREIAKRIYVSPKTVESNLARVYRKLGIRSRAELGRAMAEREQVKT
jgi:DNA-binding CsgD family transcriptional regulator/predicted negative regulator of RcsB-dependent stress response